MIRFDPPLIIDLKGKYGRYENLEIYGVSHLDLYVSSVLVKHKWNGEIIDTRWSDKSPFFQTEFPKIVESQKWRNKPVNKYNGEW